MKNDILINIITASNNAGITQINNGLQEITKTTKSFSDKITEVSTKFTIISEFTNRVKDKFVGIFGAAINDADELNAAMTGLKSIVEGTGGKFSEAEAFIKDFTKDGLVPVGDAATSLKNLLARGFGLDEARKIMDRFKDSAAFGRQSSLQLGEAIKGATEGLKNENSVLVDNAGVTKNVSVMWKEYADSIGESVKNLTIEQKREAELQGIMKETRFQIGDAAKLTEQYGGKKAKLEATMKQLSQTIGEALLPALSGVMEIITPIIQGISNWMKENPKLSQTIIIIVGILGSLLIGFTSIMAVLPILSGGFLALKISAIGLGKALLFLAANPVGIIITAIAGIVAVGVLLYKNWDKISKELGKIWDYISLQFTKLWKGIEDIVNIIIRYIEFLKNSILSILENIKNTIAKIWEDIKQSAINLWNSFVNAIIGIWEGFKEKTIQVFTSIKDGIVNIFMAPIKMIMGIWDFVSGLWNKITGKSSNLKTSLSISQNISTVGGRAYGGNVSAGRAYTVGERGRELFVPETNGKIVPNEKIGGNVITINMGGVVVNTEADEIRLIEKMKQELSRTLQLNKRGIL